MEHDELTIHDYPELDLSPAHGKVAILCETKSEFINVVAAMKLQHPGKCKNWSFSDAGRYFTNYNDFHCICIGFESHWARMVHGPKQDFEEVGYEILPFSCLSIHKCLEITDEDQEEFTTACISLIC